jgi:hypothetical protein
MWYTFSMATEHLAFHAWLDSVFFPVEGKKKKKKRNDPPEPGYASSDASGESVKSLAERSFCSFYLGSDYPELVVAGMPVPDSGGLAERLSALFPSRPSLVTEKVDGRKLSLFAFRADSYFLYTPPDGDTSHPAFLVKKTVLTALEAALNQDGSLPPPENAGLPSADAWNIGHPAECIVSRLFMPPRLSISSYTFACVPLSLSSKLSSPPNSRPLCFNASWTFAGQPLAVRYHFDLPPTAGPQLEPLVRAVAAGLFKEALSFWGSWKRPVEKPAITVCPPAQSPNASFLIARVRGEGQNLSCAVELPNGFIGLILRMAQVAPLNASSPAGVLDCMRANDALFLMLYPAYRKPFLSPPRGVVPFTGPTVYGLLSLADEADKSVIIQNFLVPQYTVRDLPLLFYYHVEQKGSGDETVWRLRPAFPIVKGEIETFLSDILREDWNYCLGNGCTHRISRAGDLVSLNNEAVRLLAQESSGGRLHLSGKMQEILKVEVLAPLEAAMKKQLEEFNSNRGAFEPLRNAHPRSLSDILARIDNQTLAMSCLGIEDILALVEKGMSHGRARDVRVEVEVIRKRAERGEMDIEKILDAKNQFVSLIRELVPDDEVVQ